MENLPTRIRQNIRDSITSPASPLSLKFGLIWNTLGYPVNFDPEWPILWDILKSHYSDSGTFIPSIVAVVVAWCDAFVSWLERAENEEAVDELLDILKSVGRLQLVLNTSTESVHARTMFDRGNRNFELVLSASRTILYSELGAKFASDLLETFSGTTKTPRIGAGVAEDPDWADVSMHFPVVSQVSERQPLTHSDQEVADSLPDIATIERPEELTKRLPYWLIVRQERRNLVLIEGSHGPSLSVLEAYLKKWCRVETGRVDRPPVVEIRLKESPFGLGVLHDTLVLETTRGQEISAILVLALAEKVLGYIPQVGRGSTGSVWEFKRTKPFK